MARDLLDLLWRDSPHAATGGRRGPRARVGVGDLVARAIALADAGGLGAVSVRALAEALGMTPMSIYTHVDSRDDLLVLMADHVHAAMPATAFGAAGWRVRLRRVADDNLALLGKHAWMLDVTDPRTALGPGTIAKYDRELRVFDGTALGDVDRDAALTLVLDFTRAAARRMAEKNAAGEFAEIWEHAAGRLATYLGEDFPLAQRVGGAAGAAMGAPADADAAWRFGLERLIDGLAPLIDPTPTPGVASA